MNKSLIQDFCNEAKKIYKEENILLHRPVFKGNEKEYLEECIDSNFVSSVGKRVDEFESKFAKFTGSKHAIAVSNGTEGLSRKISFTSYRI